MMQKGKRNSRPILLSGKRPALVGAAICLWMCIFAQAGFASGVSRESGFPVQGIYQVESVLKEGFVLDARHDEVPGSDVVIGELRRTTEKKQDNEIQLFREMFVKQQEFYLQPVSSHSCYLVNLESGAYLEAGEITRTERTDLNGEALPEVVEGRVSLVMPQETDTAETKKRRLWSLVSRPDGSFLIRSCDGLYLSVQQKRAFNKAAVHLEEFSGKKHQKWQFAEAPVYADDVADTAHVNPYLEDGELARIRVTLQLFDDQEILDSGKLAGWMVMKEDGTLDLSEEKLQEFVSSLAERYNTVGKPRTFQTSYGSDITLYKGNFGWKLDEQQMTASLREAVSKPGFRTVTPDWAQKGGAYNGVNTDIGDSYVEVDLNKQKVWLYQDGKKLLETDCVSGTAGTDRETPGGVYFVFYKQSPATLTGPGYASPVSYWMPFNGGVGLHDATWRSTFGGDIYKTDGSHGCVNLPLEAAKLMYETVKIGWPVVCYH